MSMAVEIARIALPLIPPSSIHLNEPHATTNNCMPWKCVVFNRLLHVVSLYTTMIILLFEATVFSQCFPVNGRQFVETRSLAGRFFTNLQRLKRLFTGVRFYSLLWNRFCICVYVCATSSISFLCCFHYTLLDRRITALFGEFIK